MADLPYITARLLHSRLRDADLSDADRAELVQLRRRRLVVLLHGPGPDTWAVTRRGRVELSSYPDPKSALRSGLCPRPPEQWDF